MPNCTGLILAGGRGQRFGGRDKGLLRARGEPLAALAAARLRPQVDELFVSIGRNRSRYRAMNLRPVSDNAPFAGPLTGIARAMTRIRTPYLVTLPCDSPDIPADYVRSLWRRLRARRADICIVRDRDGLQPLHALMKTRLNQSLTHYLAGGGTAVHQWVMQQRWTSVHLDVSNINDSAALRSCTVKVRRRPNL